MSSDALWKRERRWIFPTKHAVRRLRQGCLCFLFFSLTFLYVRIFNYLEPERPILQVARLQGASGIVRDRFAVPEVGSDSDCGPSEPCETPDPPMDEILDAQLHHERLIQDVEHILTPYGKEVMTYNIDKLKVFIYPLPSQFNSDLILCASENKANSMCFNFAHAGFGPEMRLTIKVSQLLKFHKTHQFSLEVLFYERLLRSPYVTTDPSQADLFYVPFFAGLACFCADGAANNLTKEFWSSAWNLTHLNTGKVHFMALGKVEQEMSSERCPMLRHQNTGLFKYLMIEQTVSPRTRQYFLRLGKEQESLVLPYPSFGHMSMPHAEIPGAENRTIMTMMAASLKKNRLRQVLRAQLEQCDRCKFYLLNADECYNLGENVGRRIVTLMTKSLFCLHPPGDTPTRKSFFDGVMCGCIPVVFNKNVKYPFDELIRYDEFTVFLEEATFTNNSDTHIVHDVLDQISLRDVVRMQRNLRAVARFLQYGAYGYGDDAFTTTLRLLLHVAN